MDQIEAAIAAIEMRDPGKPFSYQKIADQYGVVASTLRRQHQGLTSSREDAIENRRNLTTHEESELLDYIKKLTERGLPPIHQIIQSFASIIAKHPISIT